MEKTQTKIKASIEHTDLLGQPIKDSHYVAVARDSGLYVCTIMKITAKMMRVKPLGWKSDFLVYPNAVIVLSGADALAYILKYGGS